MVKIKFNNSDEEHRAFKFNDYYYTGTRKFVNPDYIVEVSKLEISFNT